MKSFQPREKILFRMKNCTQIQCLQLGPDFWTLVRIRTFLTKLIRMWSEILSKSPDPDQSPEIRTQLEALHNYSTFKMKILTLTIQEISHQYVMVTKMVEISLHTNLLFASQKGFSSRNGKGKQFSLNQTQKSIYRH